MEPTAPTPGSGDHLSTNIVVVDDDDTLLDLVIEVFKERDWQVIPCPDPTRAIDTIKLTEPALVILDIAMGSVFSGWKVLQMLKQDLLTRTIPVLVWTGLPALDDKQTWLNERGIKTIAKPFDIEALFSTVDELLSTQRKTPA
jgi:DNA-binding response OmpR family regulator